MTAARSGWVSWAPWPRRVGHGFRVLPGRGVWYWVSTCPWPRRMSCERCFWVGRGDPFWLYGSAWPRRALKCVFASGMAAAQGPWVSRVPWPRAYPLWVTNGLWPRRRADGCRLYDGRGLNCVRRRTLGCSLGAWPQWWGSPPGAVRLAGYAGGNWRGGERLGDPGGHPLGVRCELGRGRMGIGE
jgi:hypothetical protein